MQKGAPNGDAPPLTRDRLPNQLEGWKAFGGFSLNHFSKIFS
jgi:hypothetical protein